LIDHVNAITGGLRLHSASRREEAD